MMHRLLPIGLCVALCVILAIPAVSVTQAGQPPAPPLLPKSVVSDTPEAYVKARSMIVGYIRTEEQGIDEAKELCEKEAGLKIIDQSRGSRYVLCGWANREQLEKGLAVLAKHPELIEYVQPNYQVEIGLPQPAVPAPPAKTVVQTVQVGGGREVRPNDPGYADLWGMENLRAPAAWATTQSTAIVVAVLDTGVDADHEDLKANMFKHTGKNPKDGKTHADVIGFDYGSGIDPTTGQYRPGFNGNPSTGPNYLKHPQADHGTHCAGTIGAVGNNGVGVAGVCWNAKIMALQIFTIFDRGGKKEISTTTQAQIDAIDYAVQNGAKVLSNSYGPTLIDPTTKLPPPNPAIDAAYRRANGKGVLVVFAAGNDNNDNDGTNRNSAPDIDTHPNVITVAAIGPKENLSFFVQDSAGRDHKSNFGLKKVSLGAPGGDSTDRKETDLILSTIPPELNAKKEKYGFKQGTSMACPHVAGAAALVWGQPQFASMTPAQLKDVLLTNARRIPGLTGKCVTGATLDLNFLGSQTPDYIPCPPNYIYIPCRPRCCLFPGLRRR